jgi:hypothetical protein
MEKLVEWTVLAGETEVHGENLTRRQFVHHKPHLLDPGANPGRRGGKPATNCLSYGEGPNDKFGAKMFSHGTQISSFSRLSKCIHN